MPSAGLENNPCDHEKLVPKMNNQVTQPLKLYRPSPAPLVSVVYSELTGMGVSEGLRLPTEE